MTAEKWKVNIQWLRNWTLRQIVIRNWDIIINFALVDDRSIQALKLSFMSNDRL